MLMRRRLSFCLLVLALLLAQTLGQVHRYVHRPLLAAGTALAITASGAERVVARSPWADLFAGHQTEGDCRLFDQLGHGDVLPKVPALSLPPLLAAGVLDLLADQVPLCPPVLYEVRGPPLTR